MSQHRLFIRKSHWKGLGGPASWVGQGLRKSPRRMNSISRVDKDSSVLPAYVCRGTLIKEMMTLASTLSKRKLPFQPLP